MDDPKQKYKEAVAAWKDGKTRGKRWHERLWQIEDSLVQMAPALVREAANNVLKENLKNYQFAVFPELKWGDFYEQAGGEYFRKYAFRNEKLGNDEYPDWFDWKKGKFNTSEVPFLGYYQLRTCWNRKYWWTWKFSLFPPKFWHQCLVCKGKDLDQDGKEDTFAKPGGIPPVGTTLNFFPWEYQPAEHYVDLSKVPRPIGVKGSAMEVKPLGGKTLPVMRKNITVAVVASAGRDIFRLLGPVSGRYDPDRAWPVMAVASAKVRIRQRTQSDLRDEYFFNPKWEALLVKTVGTVSGESRHKVYQDLVQRPGLWTDGKGGRVSPPILDHGLSGRPLDLSQRSVERVVRH